MKQQSLQPLTEFEQITAQQLTWCAGKDRPDDRGLQQAIKLAVKWNKKRKAMGLNPWK